VRHAGWESSSKFVSAVRELARNVVGLLDLEGGDLDSALAELHAAIYPPVDGRPQLPDDLAVIAGFERRLPRCMKLVPRCRRKRFVRGVYRFVIDEGNDVSSC
jgi:hypothetical protein